MSLFFVKSNYLPVRKLVGVLADKAGIPFDQRHNEFGFIEDALSSTLGDKQKVDRVLDKQLQHLRQSFLGRLLKGRVDPSMSVQEALSLYDLHFSSDDFAVMVFYIKEIEGKALGGMDREKQFQLARYIIRNVFEELIGRKHFGLITEVDDLQAALCNLSPGAADPEGDLADAAREGLQFLQENFGIHISVTQSTVMHSLEEIPAAYTEAYTATEYNILMGRADLTSYRDIELGLKEGNQTYYYYYPLQVEVQLTNFIKSGDYNNAKKILNELFEINFKQFSLPSMITKCFMFNLTSTIMKTIYEITAPDHNDLSELGAVERLLGCQSVTEMDMELNKILIRLCEYTREKNEASDLIRRAVQYIQKHYSDEALSITQIAEQLSLSPSYLSKRFKEVHGLGLLDYINKTRIEAAKVLLTGTERTIQEIAESCGFTGSNTFIRTFKKSPDHNDLSELGAVERLLGCQSVTEMDMELNKILIRLCEYTREKNEASDLIRRAVQYIQKHYSDEALSITQIAEQLSLSPSYLSKRFKEVHGLGLLDYINKTRIEAAKVLLTGTERTIQEIAESCGFTGSNTFIRTFKKYEGITPGKYREVSSSPQE